MVGVVTQAAVSVNQVVEAATETEFVAEIMPETKRALPVLPQQTETTIADVQVAYKEEQLEDFVPGKSRTAHPVREEHRAVEVDEVQVDVMGSPLKSQVAKKEKANSSIQISDTPVIEETVVFDATGSHKDLVFKTETPSVSITTQNALLVDQVIEAANGREFASTFTPESRQATCVLPEQKETTVADVQVAYKEEPLQDFVPVPNQTARTVTEERRTALVSEVHSSVSESPMQTKAPKMETAQSHLPVAEAAIVQENSSLDFVTTRAV